MDRDRPQPDSGKDTADHQTEGSQLFGIGVALHGLVTVNR